MTEHIGSDAGLTDLSTDEARSIDHAMGEHMYRHSISNSYPAMACDVTCRTRAIADAVNAVLTARRPMVSDSEVWCAEHGKACPYGCIR